MEAVENTPWTIFSSQRTDLSTISTSPLTVATLYKGLCVADMPVAESVLNIRSFMHSSPRIAAARNLRGKEAQGLIDLIDQVSSA